MSTINLVYGAAVGEVLWIWKVMLYCSLSPGLVWVQLCFRTYPHRLLITSHPHAVNGQTSWELNKNNVCTQSYVPLSDSLVHGFIRVRENLRMYTGRINYKCKRENPNFKDEAVLVLWCHNMIYLFQSFEHFLYGFLYKPNYCLTLQDKVASENTFNFHGRKEFKCHRTKPRFLFQSSILLKFTSVNWLNNKLSSSLLWLQGLGRYLCLVSSCQ